MVKTLTSITFLLCLFTAFAGAQSPTNPTADIPWSGTYNTNSDIETAFNQARRTEEQQLGLSNGILGNITIPTDWNDYNDGQKALYLLNQERSARGGVDFYEDFRKTNFPVHSAGANSAGRYIEELIREREFNLDIIGRFSKDITRYMIYDLR